MIVYDNAQQYKIIFQKTGSVLPGTLRVGAFTCAIGTTLAVLRYFEYSGDLFGEDAIMPGKDAVVGREHFIQNPFSIQTIAVVIGYLLVVRINMALGRWMDGISEIQLMLSKWGDAFDALNGFYAARHLTASMEQRERILNFRIRIAHWFSLMSCLAFATLRNKGELKSLDNVPIKEMFLDASGGHKKTKSFTATISEKTAEDRRLEERADAISQGLIQGLDLVVLAPPTSEEIGLLTIANDKVNCVCLWIIQGIIMEWRAGTLDVPPPIVSRVFQEISNGMLGYNQAHKVAMVPFPFPFAQMVSLLLCVLYVGLPFYIDTFTMNIIITPIISFLLPICYCGLNLIAIELEEPFGIDWNDVDIEVRHEEFLWLLVDVLRQPDGSPVQLDHTLERRILRGAAKGVPLDLLAVEIARFSDEKTPTPRTTNQEEVDGRSGAL